MTTSCRHCHTVTHATADHKNFYDDVSKNRQAYLRGWQHQTLETTFPSETTGRAQYMFDLGVSEAEALVLERSLRSWTPCARGGSKRFLAPMSRFSQLLETNCTDPC